MTSYDEWLSTNPADPTDDWSAELYCDDCDSDTDHMVYRFLGGTYLAECEDCGRQHEPEFDE